jgi:hypothetical protein
MTGYYPRRRGILEHLERGTVSLLDSAIHDVLSLWADYRTGVCWASAEKLNVLCPADFSYKSIQRSLAKLERLGWIKRWVVRGKRGNYPILVCRYFVRDASMKWWSTNGERTMDWRHVQIDPVHDQSFNGPSGVRSDVRERGGELSVEVSAEVSGLQEVRTKNGKSKIDDDDDPARRDEKARHAAPSATGNGKAEPIKPALRAWMNARILRNAVEVRNRRAYLNASQPEFLTNLEAEIHSFLVEKAEQCLTAQLTKDPQATVPWNEVFVALRKEAEKHELPISDGRAFERATRAAGEILGLAEIANSQVLKNEQVNPAHGPLRREPSYCAQCGRTASWHKRSLEKLMREDPKYDGHGFKSGG